jgi:hypothetical protein
MAMFNIDPYLCDFCLGINERSTSYSKSTSPESLTKYPYAHQPSLVALETSAIKGCTLCRYVFDRIREQCRNYGKDNELRHALNLSASSLTPILWDDSNTISNNDQLNPGLPDDDNAKDIEDIELQVNSCIELGWRIAGPNSAGLPHIETCSMDPPQNSTPGSIFVSQKSDKGLRYLSFALSGRPWDQLLQFNICVNIEVFTTPGKQARSS